MKTQILSLCCMLSGVAVAEERMYQREQTLTDTMLATRARYTAWLAEQKAARTAVVCGPWSEGEESRPGWKDGTLLLLSEDPSRKTVTLSRTVTAKRAVTLTVGLGGGDTMELRLNDKPLATLDTKLELKRYGTSMRVEGDRRNQVLLDLALAAGENRLAVHVSQKQIVPRRVPLQFFFSVSPDPVPALWGQARKDFPPAENPLLEAVSQTWLEPGGWFDSPNDARLESEFLGKPGSLQECVAGTLTDAEVVALAQGAKRFARAGTE